MEKWRKIQGEGILWGMRSAPSRCTYLTPLIEEARRYGDVVLEVKYDPTTEGKNNYFPDEWQHREYNPIPLSKVRIVGSEVSK